METTTNEVVQQSQQWIDRLVEWATLYGLKVIAALLIFIIGKWVAGLIRKGLRRAMERSKVDPVLVGFLSSIAYYGLMVAVVIAAISQVGIQTTSFIAVLGAAGLAVGLALQGSLANFASGVLIILFRPFKVGDFVEAGGVSGVVDEIGILVTNMHTPDNKAVIVPNAQIMSGEITNYTANATRRCDLVFGISYADDFEKAKAILTDIVENDARCLKDPAPTIRVLELADSSVNIACRPWVASGDYWDVYFDMHEAVKKRFDAEGISIPFPQRDVHLFQEK
jgi:small conductance mechanosensitive channel